MSELFCVHMIHGHRQDKATRHMLFIAPEDGCIVFQQGIRNGVTYTDLGVVDHNKANVLNRYGSSLCSFVFLFNDELLLLQMKPGRIAEV